MRDDAIIFLAQPGYGSLTAAAARGFWRASRLPEDRVIYRHDSGSLLANNFNRLWCAALNARKAGVPVEYFAMLHSDVGPEDWWLDTLTAELDATGLDVLGTVVPIKSPREGVTSLALANPETDPWRVLCRLTMDEVYSLPETFTSDDLGHPLLLNTGCWVCRFDPAWAERVHFEINDRIVRTPDGTYHAEVEPEDWFFSRLCHELGLKVGATRKLKLDHRGEVNFPNRAPWGDPFDSAYVERSVVPPQKRDGFVFPADVDGWLTYDEGRALYDLARDRRVLEIGSYCGRSTICLAQSAAHVVAVDPHDGRATPRPRDTFDEFRANLDRYGVAPRVTPVKSPRADGCGYDLAFIDGDHATEAVRRDIEASVCRLVPGGVLAFHDYRRDPSVTRAVDEYLSAGGELLSTVGSLAVVRPPAATILEV